MRQRRWILESGVRRRHALMVVAGVLLGFGIWATAPTLLGETEPWDTNGPYYAAVMLIGGFLLGFAAPTALGLLLVFAAVWSGQVVALALLVARGDPPWFPLGAIATGVGSLLALGGALLGRLAEDLSNRGRSPNEES